MLLKLYYRNQLNLDQDCISKQLITISLRLHNYNSVNEIVIFGMNDDEFYTAFNSSKHRYLCAMQRQKLNNEDEFTDICFGVIY
jgi:hypothetical protein